MYFLFLMMTSWIFSFIILLLTATYLTYMYMTRHFDYWKKRNIPYIKPLPFFGNFYEIVSLKVHNTIGLKNIYDKMNEPFFGIFVFDQPVLMLKSQKLIHDIMIKDSNNFLDRTLANPSIYSKFVFFQTNPNWKINRTKLSRLFTPAKMKRVFEVVNDVSQNLVKTINKETTIDIRDLMTRFTAEFMAKCYFGTNDNCLENDESVFLKNMKNIFKFTWRNAFVQSSYFFKGPLADTLNLLFIPTVLMEYFRNLILQTLNHKRSSNENSNDFIGFFTELYAKNKENDEEITKEELDEISAYVLNFTFASDGVGMILSHILYELALQENIQERLRNEIKDIVGESETINYEMLQQTKLLDHCISETIRKYPIIPVVCRKAAEPYTLSGTNVTIDKGTWIYIPLYALSYDEHIFSNPDEYNPDRFQDLEKREGESSFLPFGAGPRSCIGERFGILVLKLAIMYVLLNFKVEKTVDTPKKLEFEFKAFLLRSRVDLKIRLIPLLK